MKFFLDTANVEEIKKAIELGMCDGVTTNPSLIMKELKDAKEGKEGRDHKSVIADIAKVVKGPISVEGIADDAPGMIKEGEEFATWAKNIVVKVPMTKEGLKAVRVLESKGIHTNVTLVFSASQALLVAKAGASYVSPFVGRLDDISQDGMELIAQIADIYDNYGFKTEIIVASVRDPVHVIDSAMIGAHIATIPAAVLDKMWKHPLTDAGIATFKEHYHTSKSKK